MLNDVDSLLKFVVASLMLEMLEVLFELRMQQSNGVLQESEEDPLNDGASGVFIGVSEQVLGRDRLKVSRRSAVATYHRSWVSSERAN